MLIVQIFAIRAGTRLIKVLNKRGAEDYIYFFKLIINYTFFLHIVLYYILIFQIVMNYTYKQTKIYLKFRSK